MAKRIQLRVAPVLVTIFLTALPLMSFGGRDLSRNFPTARSRDRAKDVTVAGGFHGGGGSCGVRDETDSRWLLKDFVRANSIQYDPLSDQRSDQRFGLHQATLTDEKAKPGTLLKAPAGQIGPMNGENGFSDIRQSAAYQNLLLKLDDWSSEDPTLALTIRGALGRMRFHGIDNWFLKQSAFGCTAEGDRPIVIYIDSHMAGFISLPMWKRLSLDSQMGVLTKEALRFIESNLNHLFLNGERKTEETEAKLSQLVDILIHSKPTTCAMSSVLASNSSSIDSSSDPAIASENGLLNACTLFNQAIELCGQYSELYHQLKRSSLIPENYMTVGCNYQEMTFDGKKRIFSQRFSDNLLELFGGALYASRASEAGADLATQIRRLRLRIDAVNLQSFSLGLYLSDWEYFAPPDLSQIQKSLRQEYVDAELKASSEQ